MTSDFKNMATEFENLISSISIEELNKVDDEEIVNLVSDLKNYIPECDKNSEPKITIIEQMLSLSDNEEPQNKRRKILKNLQLNT